MNTESQIRDIEQRVTSLISSDPGSFLVEVRIKPGNNVKVFIDADSGVSIEKLIQYNRNLYKQIEENRLFPMDDFSLEVSSPGLDEPLKLPRQYVKNIGRNVEVLLKSGIKKEGKLVYSGDDEIRIEEETGKKKHKELVVHAISLADIKTTRIQIKF